MNENFIFFLLSSSTFFYKWEKWVVTYYMYMTMKWMSDDKAPIIKQQKMQVITQVGIRFLGHLCAIFSRLGHPWVPSSAGWDTGMVPASYLESKWRWIFSLFTNFCLHSLLFSSYSMLLGKSIVRGKCKQWNVRIVLFRVFQ